MKKSLQLAVATAVFVLAGTGIIYAGTWKKEDMGWRFSNEQDDYVKNEWSNIDNHWYFFDEQGYMVQSQWIGNYYLGADGAMLVNTTTPDGYNVDANGQWIHNSLPELTIENSKKHRRELASDETFEKITQYLKDSGMKILRQDEISVSAFFTDENGIGLSITRPHNTSPIYTIWMRNGAKRMNSTRCYSLEDVTKFIDKYKNDYNQGNLKIEDYKSTNDEDWINNQYARLFHFADDVKKPSTELQGESLLSFENSLKLANLVLEKGGHFYLFDTFYNSETGELTGISMHGYFGKLYGDNYYTFSISSNYADADKLKFRYSAYTPEYRNGITVIDESYKNFNEVIQEINNLSKYCNKFCEK